MLRIMMVLCLTLLEVVNATAQTTTRTVKTVTHTVTHHEVNVRDPDGDRDTKGWNIFPAHRPATGNRVFIFDPKRHAWAAYNENGERVNVGRASGGRAFCRDVRRPCRTIVGTFEVLSKGGAYCKSNIYPIRTGGGAPMPYCMRFSQRGYAIHGSSSVPNYNASHGCIRVSPTAARWLSQNFVQIGTTVIVLSY